MAAFIALTSWQGEYTDDYFARPAPDPAMFGMPTEDDGTRDDPLLSDRAWAFTEYRPDVEALAAAPTRVVIAVGEESRGHLHRPHRGGDRRTARPAGDRVPEPPWRLPGRRARLRRPARGVRPDLARRPRRTLTGRRAPLVRRPSRPIGRGWMSVAGAGGVQATCVVFIGASHMIPERILKTALVLLRARQWATGHRTPSVPSTRVTQPQPAVHSAELR